MRREGVRPPPRTRAKSAPRLHGCTRWPAVPRATAAGYGGKLKSSVPARRPGHAWPRRRWRRSGQWRLARFTWPRRVWQSLRRCCWKLRKGRSGCGLRWVSRMLSGCRGRRRGAGFPVRALHTTQGHRTQCLLGLAWAGEARGIHPPPTPTRGQFTTASLKRPRRPRARLAQMPRRVGTPRGIWTAGPRPTAAGRSGVAAARQTPLLLEHAPSRRSPPEKKITPRTSRKEEVSLPRIPTLAWAVAASAGWAAARAAAGAELLRPFHWARRALCSSPPPRPPPPP
mmetsp:Transcript_26454/g.83834  ORF Transcript_26454/g.83834 Transcript_26454/m.83834 type:complete len:284 (-) Transcript_26454:244-1095(-)